MSPAFMNQRRMAEGARMIPPQIQKETTEEQPVAEEIVFDKAEMAEERENEKERLQARIQQLEGEAKDASDERKANLQIKIEAIRARLKSLEETQEP